MTIFDRSEFVDDLRMPCGAAFGGKVVDAPLGATMNSSSTELLAMYAEARTMLVQTLSTLLSYELAKIIACRSWMRT